jgi:hypothetical protein
MFEYRMQSTEISTGGEKVLDKQLCKLFGKSEVTLFEVIALILFLGVTVYAGVVVVQSAIERPFEAFVYISTTLGFILIILSGRVIVAKCPKNKQ